MAYVPVRVEARAVTSLHCVRVCRAHAWRRQSWRSLGLILLVCQNCACWAMQAGLVMSAGRFAGFAAARFWFIVRAW